MNESDIRKYANLMSELGLTGLEVTENDRVVRLERNPAPQTTAPVQTVQVGDVPQSAANEDLIEISSPMVGVFYAAPAEDADPYVQVGDRVKKGQTLCIVEAMKLMNEIVAETDGQIVEICAQNGQVVDFGCPLFRIK
ncbi:MAG: acetyl-CoA carboxylase biotin carboxyl carrier protein [Firmicutes bacterium]|nr:acetyl-CoA carboxylase biotin carboxyl carrier protein [Bacillota bacterium]MEE1367227.1 acetyl-CoA carboxylase biotin carboxyl carrier protein [Evtepia sp.]